MFFIKDRENDNVMIGSLLIELKNGVAVMKFYPFSGSAFFADLKKTIATGAQDNFASFKGKKKYSAARKRVDGNLFFIQSQLFYLHRTQ